MGLLVLKHYQRCNAICLFSQQTVNFIIVFHTVHRDKISLNVWTVQHCWHTIAHLAFPKMKLRRNMRCLEMYFLIFFFDSGLTRIYCGDLWGRETWIFWVAYSSSAKGPFLYRKFAFEWKESQSASAVKLCFDQSPSAWLVPCIVQQLALHQVRWWLSDFSF